MLASIDHCTARSVFRALIMEKVALVLDGITKTSYPQSRADEYSFLGFFNANGLLSICPAATSERPGTTPDSARNPHPARAASSRKSSPLPARAATFRCGRDRGLRQRYTQRCGR